MRRNGLNMTKPIVGNPQYDDEFEEPVSVFEFVEWLFANGKGLALNLASKETKPLHEWIVIFLAWSEYSDYKERHKDD